ncbi:MAG TPA: primosomal protein N' [Thermoleophilia bacterium]|nr:primosomal protein N' [Thermoleophilia bacterium]
MSYAAVFPLVRTRAFAEAFDYEVPAHLAAAAQAGALVAAPLGARTVIGVVLEIRDASGHEGRVLPLHDVLRVPPVPPGLLDLARRVERHYLSSFAAALTLVCPPVGALKVDRRYELTEAGAAAVAAGEEALGALGGIRLPAGPLPPEHERYRRRGWLRVAYRARVVGVAAPDRALRRGSETPARLGPRQRSALTVVEQAGSIGERELRAAAGLSAAGLRRLLAEGALVSADPAPGAGDDEAGTSAPSTPVDGGHGAEAPIPLPDATACAAVADMPDLLDEQRRALRCVLCDARPGDEVLLHGVTGSGKTEVYLQAAQQVLEAGRSVLLLVPEIGLTGQTVARVRRRFTGIPVAVLHSGLSARERVLAYAAIARGEVRIVVGARSAVFAPLADLGLIVVDEEHDTSYKQESEPAYDARTVARWRAAADGAVVILGSATPSVEAYDRVALHADLRQRVDGTRPPALEVVDMRAHHGLFSDPLREALTGVVDAGEKAILFINRRGIASYLVCEHCGHAWECPRCDVTLTLFGGRTLRCRTCGHREPAPSACPICGRSDLVRHGYGTERVEREVRLLLPGVDLLRLDSDVAGSYARLQQVLTRFREPGPKVLVGTQMIAKGHHFPDVTLVGVVNADLTLRFPDFRAEERTHSLLVQVGGRSGRGERPGRVIVQTLDPEARPIALAAAGEDERFYAEELARRRELGYPPAGFLVGLDLSSLSRDKLEAAGRFTAERLAARLGDHAQVLGPGPLWRERGRHTCRLVMKTNEAGKTLDTLREWLAADRDRYAARGVRVVPDVEPQWL